MNRSLSRVHTNEPRQITQTELPSYALPWPLKPLEDQGCNPETPRGGEKSHKAQLSGHVALSEEERATLRQIISTARISWHQRLSAGLPLGLITLFHHRVIALLVLFLLASFAIELPTLSPSLLQVENHQLANLGFPGRPNSTRATDPCGRF